MSDSKKEASSLAIVIHQIIDLKVDISRRLIYGITEIVADAPKGTKGLDIHSHGLTIKSAMSSWRASEATKLSAAPVAAKTVLNYEDFSEYGDQLNELNEKYLDGTTRDLLPELCIRVPPPPSDDATQVTLRIVYEVQAPQAGVHFHENYAVTDNVVRMCSAWVPCVDIPNAQVLFELRLTVPANIVAVASGQLVKQSWADIEHKWKTFHYDLSQTCAPCDIGFAMGPFAVMPGGALPAGHDTTITHFFPQPEHLQGGDPKHSAAFFDLPFVLFCDEVVCPKFSLPSMSQVFLPSAAARVPLATFLGLQVLSTDLLVNTRGIEQSQMARCAIAGALARQWFGYFIKPATVDDAWLVEGLAGWLEEQYVREYMGKTELAYRRWQQRRVVCTLDTGDAPPLAYGYNGASPWGPLNGTERLDPSPLRRFKATAVVAMLERRAGEGLFRKHIEALIANAVTTAAPIEEIKEPVNVSPNEGDAAVSEAPAAVELPKPEAAAAQPGSRRSLDAAAFLNELARAGDFKKEIGVFLQRWVFGRGTPDIIVGSEFHRRGCTLEVAIRQSGSYASRDAACAAEVEAQKEGIGTGVIKVAVREGSGATVEHPVHIGIAPYVLAELRINPEVKRVHAKRGRKRKDEEEQLAAMQAALANAQHPVQYMRLDPAGEWLCTGYVQQSERMLKNQLNDSKDVVAQCEAVRGIGQLRLGVVGQGPLAALEGALYDDKHLHCRVRMEAARALGSLKDESGASAGLGALLKFYKKRYWDNSAAGDAARPISFTDVSEYLVAKAVISAVANATVADGSSDYDSIFFLKVCAEQYCSAWEAYDDRGLLAAICTGLGQLRAPIGEPDLAEYICKFAYFELERYLECELVSPSPGAVVGSACLEAMVQLAGNGTCPQEVIHKIGSLISSYCEEACAPLRLRASAFRSFARFLAGLKGWPAALEFACRCSSVPGTAAQTLARAAWEEVAVLAVVAGENISQASKDKAAQMALQGRDSRLRHLAFIAACRLDHRPPTLFDPEEQSARKVEAALAAQVQPSMNIKLGAGAVPMDADIPAASAGAPPLSGTVGADDDAAAPSLPLLPAAGKLKLKLGAKAAVNIVGGSDATPAQVVMGSQPSISTQQGDAASKEIPAVVETISVPLSSPFEEREQLQASVQHATGVEESAISPSSVGDAPSKPKLIRLKLPSPPQNQ